MRTERVFMGDSILRKTDTTLSKGEDVVCFPGALIEHVTERVENTLGQPVFLSTVQNCILLIAELNIFVRSTRPT